MKFVIFALIPLILSIGIIPAIPLDANADYIDKFSLPYVLDTLTDSQIKDCESIHKEFVSLSDSDFYTRYQTNNFVGNCVMLYEDSLWDYDGSDRYQKLSDRSEELIQEYETKLQDRQDIFYIESKSLTELQIPGKFLYIFEGCTGDQTLHVDNVSVVSDKETVLLTKFVGEEREIQPGVCNKLEVQIYADDPSSIKIVISSLDVEIHAKLDESMTMIESVEIDSPRKQMQMGIESEDVICKSELVLMIRISGDAACVKSSSVEKLTSIGFGTIQKESSMMETVQEDERPNILLIVLDDVGSFDLGFTSSEISTPVMNSLANSEILMTNYHVSPTCSPTRAMMLTGVDNHLSGLGTMNEILADNQKGKPGYETYLNYDVVTVSSLLLDADYHTYMSGKWHLSYGAVERNVEDRLDQWTKYDPYARGFEETFSAALPGNHFNEKGITYGHTGFYTQNGERVTLPDDFYSATSYTDYLIEMIDKNHGDGKPMFMYLPFWTSHFPLHAPDEYIQKYDGVYDKGWDEIRKERFEIQKELGLIPQELELPPRLDAVPSWEELTPEQQKIEAKKMQVYAAMTDVTDVNIGRVIDHLKDIEEYDDTLIFIFSDNGAESSDALKKIFHADTEEEYQEWLSQYDNSLESIGTEKSNISLGLGWAQVGNTPLFREKGYVTEGGTRVPMIVKLPGDSVSLKTDAFSTVLDITPTILDYANIEHPGNFYDDRDVHTISGKSLKPLFDGETDRIYAEDEPIGMELFGNQAIFKGDWKALLLTIPPYYDTEWRLYNLAEDVRELNGLSSEYPELLEELISDYEDYAERVGVIPPIGLEIPR